MPIEYLKRGQPAMLPDLSNTTRTVQEMLGRMEAEGEAATRDYSRKLDSWNPESFIVGPHEIAAAEKVLPETVKDDIRFAQKQVREFAQRQRQCLLEFEFESHPGLIVGQRQIPVSAAGCYVPGGRFAHLASAAMSIATAKAAGVGHVTACSPPRDKNGIHPATLFGMSLAGADTILSLGGVQAIGAMTFGHFTGKPVNFLAGPGNRFVAEAKRLLFGRVGIDVVAGPTESLIIADDSADPWLVAVDLISQAEHGAESQTILITSSRQVGQAVLDLIPRAIAQLPADSIASTAWENLGEVAVTDTREEAAALADQYANEHVQVQAADLEWWLKTLQNYGSLFLGEETTVTYGDKTSGPNHILPTRGGATYTGGLWVGKFIKTVTYQRMTRPANDRIARVAARISRVEGMEGHALAGDARLEKYFPGQPLNTSVPAL
ncbi:histidinol dehydrogenase [Arthrobacter sp. Soil764]|uniref:histidinol dehydrogenase n=1 Tax=Arthrobacter sp. Soil764 TaxID=1736403 RepID=UPI0006FD5793|nr:histidinol dehydrogenase [Arthrobacter sp. Soil764]KRE81439.1 histidinol dehydrogenase [Arthrobacter sp. Soil764]